MTRARSANCSLPSLVIALRSSHLSCSLSFLTSPPVRRSVHLLTALLLRNFNSRRALPLTRMSPHRFVVFPHFVPNICHPDVRYSFLILSFPDDPIRILEHGHFRYLRTLFLCLLDCPILRVIQQCWFHHCPAEQSVQSHGHKNPTACLYFFQSCPSSLCDIHINGISSVFLRLIFSPLLSRSWETFQMKFARKFISRAMS